MPELAQDLLAGRPAAVGARPGGDTVGDRDDRHADAHAGTIDRSWRSRDRLGRPLRNLRLSVTDRCNLRCAYCMPEADYAWLPREDILHFEEIGRLVDVVHRTRRRPRPADGRRAARAPRPARARRDPRRQAAAPRPRHDDQRRAARRSRRPPCRRRGSTGVTVSLDTLRARHASASSRASTSCRACSPASTRRPRPASRRSRSTRS